MFLPADRTKVRGPTTAGQFHFMLLFIGELAPKALGKYPQILFMPLKNRYLAPFFFISHNPFFYTLPPLYSNFI
jgi:hypothetical protein